MAHISLYRKYRPTTWDGVIGQGHIVTTLINQIKTNTVSHAYLFTGTRGTGKTSSAKIFAKAVNCLDPKNGSPCGVCSCCQGLSNPANMDILELDAASNNGVDEIRELRENVQYPPTVGRYKVYIIDEVHMLTSSAFNALLKTLEEPPAHAIFILATTEAHKLPQTILSRCMRFDFRLVSKEELISLLKNIFDAEGCGYDPRALELIALHGEGSVRDALSLADMCKSFSPSFIGYEAALEVLGASDFSTLTELARAVLSGDISGILSITNQIRARGKGIATLGRELAGFFRDLIAVKNIGGYRAGFNDEEYQEVYKLAEGYDNYRIGRILDILSLAENSLRYSTQPGIIFDACLVKAAEIRTELSLEAVNSRIRQLETKLQKFEEGGVTLKEAPKKEEKPAVNSLEERLSKFATGIDVKPVFDNPPEKTAEKTDYAAKTVWGSLLTRLREEQYTLLYLALQKVEDVSASNNVLTAVIKDIATLELLSTGDNAEIVERILKEVSPSLSFAYKNALERSIKLEQDRKKLSDIFGDKFVDKTIK